MSDYLENSLLNAVFNQTAYSSPTSLHLALFTADNGLEAGTITGEVSGTGYARQTITTAFGTASGSTGVISNTAEILFPSAGVGGWGTVTHCAVLDQSNNVLVHGTLSSPKLVNEGDTFSFPATDLSVTFA